MEIVLDKKSEKGKEILRLIMKCFFSFDGVLALGGDGTMLKSVHLYNFNRVFLVLNCGHRGSLVNDIVEDYLERIRDKKFEIHQFPLLEVETEDGWKGLGLEVYVKGIGPKTCKTEVRVDGTTITERLAG